jgi:hypothetical protein
MNAPFGLREHRIGNRLAARVQRSGSPRERTGPT